MKIFTFVLVGTFLATELQEVSTAHCLCGFYMTTEGPTYSTGSVRNLWNSPHTVFGASSPLQSRACMYIVCKVHSKGLNHTKSNENPQGPKLLNGTK